MRRNRKARQEEAGAVMEEQEAGPEQEGESAPDGGSATAPPAAAGGDDRTAKLEAEVAELKDRYLRSLAEMDNVRRRARLDAEEARKFANETLMAELLPVLDNLARALEAAEQTTNFEALQSGVEQTRRKLAEVLGRAGLERIEAVGRPFDPNVHEAIMQVEPRDGQGPNEVVEELQAGYMLNDRVLRPSLVKVTSG
jgi:molecular chaperone GrpE